MTDNYPSATKRDLAATIERLRAELDEAYEYDNLQHAAIVRDTLEIGELEAERDALRARLAAVTGAAESWFQNGSCRNTHDLRLRDVLRAALAEVAAASTRSLAGVPDAGGAALDVDALENYCMNTYFGGYHDNQDKLKAFQHGMQTVIRTVRDHQKEAAQRAAPLPDATYEAFATAVDLGSYATEKKISLASETLEHEYWQGVADACRKISAVYRGSKNSLKIWSDKIDAALPPAPAAEGETE